MLVLKTHFLNVECVLFYNFHKIFLFLLSSTMTFTQSYRSLHFTNTYRDH